MRILLIEDDHFIGSALLEALKCASNAVDWVKNGNDGIVCANTHDYDAIILDLGLPQISGFEVLTILRNSKNDTPILIVTAQDDIGNRIKGLDDGADDYIVKPFNCDELMARIRAIIRRKNNINLGIMKFGDLELNKASFILKNKDDEIALTKREAALLEALIIQPNIIHSRSMLEEKIYGWGDEIESNAIEFLIHSIRKKIGKHAIKNIRGIGWTLRQTI